ncbi:MAG: radical SAM protein [bacterium]|nr:radical SAM protein [bacterium]MDP2703985.1 radical SAM protein [bacterium]
MSYRWSSFCLQVPVSNGIILKSSLTGAVEFVPRKTLDEINAWLGNQNRLPEPSLVAKFTDSDTAILVAAEQDEYHAWREELLQARNNGAHTFILHFLPTIQCQFACSYCFENGADRSQRMRPEIVLQSEKWLNKYLTAHPEVDTLRLVFFGGEPLLCKDIVRDALTSFHAVANRHDMEFWSELVTNGELLDEEMARTFSEHQWRRVQITLDGPEDVHNLRRGGKDGRPTFRNVMSTIQMLVSTDYIQKVDVRISLDMENADRIPELVHELEAMGKQDRMSLSLGIITPTFSSTPQSTTESALATKALVTWIVARECGFEIPDEFITGPWCVAIAKHSAVLQPNGYLQKCFCTSGRPEYNFGTIQTEPPRETYLKDERFENFCRTDACIEENCAYLPMCGGGCIHDAVVAAGGPDGFRQRICQKQLLTDINEGLIRLNYDER